MVDIIYVVCILGFCLSLYALHVERSAEEDTEYVAYCDISIRVSCSKVFLSEYGKIFSHLGFITKDSMLDLPNALFGSIFYLLIALIKFISNISSKILALNILLSLSVVSMVLSAYLSYILTFVLQDVCVVCYSTYICNALIFYWSWQSIRNLNR